jgi:protein-disulfide isomerase
MNERKLLVLTSIILSLLVFFTVLYIPNQTKINLNTDDHYTYGNPKAKSHLILFEEFACSSCKEFNQETLLKLEEKYLRQGHLKITIIPLAFLDDSLSACAIAISIKKLSSEHMKPFINFIFSLNDEILAKSTFRDLLSLYLKNDPTLPAPKILKSLAEQDYEKEINRNLKLAQDIYKGDVRVPIVILNGKLQSNKNFEALCKEIDETL